MAKRGRGGRGYQRRRVDIREVRQRFLIVCEGERTEPAYFEAFRAPHVVVRIESANFDPLRIVETTIRRRDIEQADFDQVWCVFDRDEVTAERFNSALEMARRNRIEVAYSNPLFELWFLLHFQDCTGSLSRPDYSRNLSRFLGRKYAKNDDSLYDVLEPHMPDAIRRAEHLLNQYHQPRPAHDDPSTTVHLLVKELRRFSRP